MRSFLLVGVAFLLLISVGYAVIIPVPGPFGPTIQAAINNAANLDTIVVSPGLYFENINFIGKDIKVYSNYYFSNNPADISNTIIDGGAVNSTVTFFTNEPPSAELLGFTIQNGIPANAGPFPGCGGGILIALAQPMVSHCRIINNFAPVEGGGIFVGNGGAHIRYSLIENNSSILNGGGIYALGSMLICEFNEIHLNVSSGSGGGIHLQSGPPSFILASNIYENSAINGAGIMCDNMFDVFIDQCEITLNVSTNNGGGIGLINSFGVHINESLLAYNQAVFGGAFYGQAAMSDMNMDLFVENTATVAGGGVYCDLADVILFGATMYGNNSPGTGGSMYLRQSNSVVTNSILSYSWSGGAIYFDIGSPGTAVIFSDFFSNPPADFWGPAIPPGLAAMVGINAKGNPCDTFANLYLNPLFVLPGSNYNLQPASPCIDGGDPSNAIDPDQTVRDIGKYYFHQAPGNLKITLLPVGIPIVIPRAGGNFQFNSLIANNTNGNMTFDVWTEAILPNSNTFGPLLVVRRVRLPGNTLLYPRTFTQGVPVNAPAGNYQYVAKVGTYPNIVLVQDNFFWKKSSTLAAGYPVEAWGTSGGEDLPGSPVTTSEPLIPVSFEITDVYPNPFNSSTRIHLSLPDEGTLCLTVYNSLGQEVAILANGKYAAGYHTFTLDADYLATGVYFVQATLANHQSATKKIVLVR